MVLSAQFTWSTLCGVDTSSKKSYFIRLKFLVSGTHFAFFFLFFFTPPLCPGFGFCLFGYIYTGRISGSLCVFSCMYVCPYLWHNDGIGMWHEYILWRSEKLQCWNALAVCECTSICKQYSDNKREETHTTSEDLFSFCYFFFLVKLKLNLHDEILYISI